MRGELGNVLWRNMRHAYGAADDMPSVLSDVSSLNSVTRHLAYDRLCSSLVHQGTRYAATLSSIPYVAALVENERTPDRDRLIYYLVAAAIGCEDDHLCAGFSRDGYKRQLREQASKRKRVNESALDYGPSVYLSCYQSVEQLAPLFVKLLHDTGVAVRIAAAYAISWTPGKGCQSSKRLGQLGLSEMTERESANCLVAYGLATLHSQCHCSVNRLKWALRSGSQLVRVAGAIAIAPHDWDANVHMILVEASEDDSLSQLYPEFVFKGGDLQRLSQIWLSRFAGGGEGTRK